MLPVSSWVCSRKGSGRKTATQTKAAAITAQRAARSFVIGRQVSARFPSPITPAERAATVAAISWDAPVFSRIIEAMAHRTTAAAPGTARSRMRRRKCPEARSELGSRARKTEGVPTVRAEIRVRWMGWKG